MLALELPLEIQTRLDSLTKLTGQTMTFLVHEAILEHVDDLEEIYVAELPLEDLRAGRTHALTLDEVERNLGLAD